MSILSGDSKEKKKQYRKKYYADNADKLKKYAKVYRTENAEKRRQDQKLYHAKNRAKANLASAEWKKKNPQKNREIQLKHKYGITPDQIMAAMNKQNHRCAVCGGINNDSGKRVLGVDHCHATGKVRGMLCGNCNRMIGMAKDSPSILMAAARYLEQWAC